MKLNICCSNSLLPGFVNVDIVPPCDQLADLSKPWPWGTSTIKFIRAWDAIEHLPDKILTMNEAWRVLEPGGQFDICVPTTEGRGAWQDPQHVSFWNRNSFFYYQDGNPHFTRFGKAYGVYAHFRILKEKTERIADEVTKLTILLEAVKP